MDWQTRFEPAQVQCKGRSWHLDLSTPFKIGVLLCARQQGFIRFRIGLRSIQRNGMRSGRSVTLCHPCLRVQLQRASAMPSEKLSARLWGRRETLAEDNEQSP